MTNEEIHHDIETIESIIGKANEHKNASNHNSDNNDITIITNELSSLVHKMERMLTDSDYRQEINYTGWYEVNVFNVIDELRCYVNDI